MERIGKRTISREAERNYGCVWKLKSRRSNLHLHFGITDFEDGEFCGFRGDFEQKKGKIRTDLRREVESDECAALTYGGNTEEWEEANANLEEK